MFELAILKNFLIALALGTLIGLEREFSQFKKKIKGFIGIRTLPLIALYGALVTHLSRLLSFWILAAGFIALAALIIIAYRLTSIRLKSFGLTSSLAAFLTFFIGVLCAYEEFILAAVVITVGVTILLYARTFSHRFAEKMKREELVDTLKFAVIAFVILPFLPNKGYGPYGIFNPFIIWLMVVFISGISFVGYILMKWFGKHGIALAGIFGGLASSTAVATSFAVRSKKETKVIHALALGVILANAVMFFRVLIISSAINPALFVKMLLPMGFLILVSITLAYFLLKKAKKVKDYKIKLTSPFTLGPALKFGVLFAAVLALVKIADIYFSSKGVYLASLISGFADVDAITISLSQLAEKDLAENIARNGIILAALVNTAAKGCIAYLFGSKQFGRVILKPFLILVLIGLVMFFLF